MELNIKEFRISGDSSDSSPLKLFESHQSSLYPFFKSDSTYKSTLLSSKEEQFNSNNEPVLEEKDNKKLNIKDSKYLLKEENNINNKQKIKTHKERNKLLLGQEKSKINKKEPIYVLKKIEIPNEEKKNERTDRNGTVINKKNKRKVKISFIDQIDKHNNLVTEIKIESFKKYNIISGMPKEDFYDGSDKNNSKCSCICLII